MTYSEYKSKFDSLRKHPCVLDDREIREAHHHSEPVGELAALNDEEYDEIAPVIIPASPNADDDCNADVILVD